MPSLKARTQQAKGNNLDFDAASLLDRFEETGSMTA
jgi:hypothetical protein